jgi:hypothetical protein
LAGEPGLVLWKMALHVGDPTTAFLLKHFPALGEWRFKHRWMKYFKAVAVEDVRTAWVNAAAKKTTMALTYFQDKVFGVSAADEILAIDCIGSDLSLAEGINEAAHDHLVTSDVREQLHNQSEHAKKCKESLETKLRKANP